MVVLSTLRDGVPGSGRCGVPMPCVSSRRLRPEPGCCEFALSCAPTSGPVITAESMADHRVLQ
eukprot:8000454-Alexandrium_andersonii.AAC.1